MGDPPQYELLGIGNAMVDVFVRAGEALMGRLERLGLTGAVQHISSEEAAHILAALGWKAGGGPAPRGSSGLIFSSGGGAANTAKIAALLGIQAGFIGSTGQDWPGEFFRGDLAASGAVPLLVPGAGKTGLCIMVSGPGGETRIAAAPGVAGELSPEHISEDAVKNSSLVVLDGYLLDRQPLTRRVLTLADKFGVPVALDTASVFRVREKTEEILQYSRNYPLIIFMNADEAIAFYQTIRKGTGEFQARGDREKAERIIGEICPVFQIITGEELFPLMVIKLGSQGAVVVAGGEIYRAETFPVIPRNSAGAGDAFSAAFLAGWLRGKSIAGSAALGNRTAREILKVPGSRIARRKLAPVKRALQKH